MALLALLDPAKAQAQDIPNHRLDFAADRSLPKCDQALSFLGFITRWVPLAVFDPPHKRELVVRLHRAPNGAKRVDVTIRDMTGATEATLHKIWAPDEECFSVLYQTANDTAKLMTSSVEQVRESLPLPSPEAPPPPTNSAAVTNPPQPPQPSEEQPTATSTSTPRPPRRWFVGAGGAFTYGITPEWAPGPRIIGGFAPLPKYPRFTVELDFAMPMLLSTRPSATTKVQIFAPSLMVTPCYVRLPLRLCALLTSGLVVASGKELALVDRSIGMFYGLGLRGGAELKSNGPLSLRFDADAAYVGRTALLESRFHTLWTPIPLNVGVAAAVAWSF